MTLLELLRSAFDAGCNQGVGDMKGFAEPDDVEFARWLAETPAFASTRDVLELAGRVGALWREQYARSASRAASPAEVRWRDLMVPLADLTKPVAMMFTRPCGCTVAAGVGCDHYVGAKP